MSEGHRSSSSQVSGEGFDQERCTSRYLGRTVSNTDTPQFLVNLFGLAAALGSFRAGWKAHARPLEPTEELAELTSVEKPAEVQDAAATAI